MRHDGYADRRRHRYLSYRFSQRSPDPRFEGHHVGSGTSCPARPARWRNPQQGHTRRKALGAARRFCGGEEEGEARFQPDEAAVSAVLTVSSKFTELGGPARSGSGSVPKDFTFPRATASTARYAGLVQRLPPSIKGSLIRCMLAHMLTESVAMSVTSTNRAGSAREPVKCLWPIGRCFFPITIQVSSTRQPAMPTRLTSSPTFISNLTRQRCSEKGCRTAAGSGRHLHTHYRGRNASPGYR